MKQDPNELVEHMTTSIIFERNTLEGENTSPTFIEKYLSKAQKKNKNAGEYVIEIGDKVDGVYYLKRGKIKSSFIGKDGNMKTFSIVGNHCLFGEQFVFHTQPSLFETVVMEDAEFYYFNRELMLDIMKNDFDVNLFIMKTLAIKSRMLAIQLEDKCIRSILQSVCRVLYSICCYKEKNRSEKRDIVLELTHQDLADILSAHRVTVTKSLSYLKKIGVVDYKYESITIKYNNRGKLKEIAWGNEE